MLFNIFNKIYKLTNTLPLHASICLYANIDFKNDKHLTSENFKPQINIKNY